MNGWSSTQFDQLTQGMQSVASNTDVAQSMFFVTPVTSFIVTIISIIGTVTIFAIPGFWLGETVIKMVPGVSALVGAVGGKGGMGGGQSDSAFAGISKVIIGIVLSALAATGAWVTVTSYGVAGLNMLAEKITSSNLFNGADTPAAIKQYKGLVSVYDNEDAANQYETLLNKEEASSQKLLNYMQKNSPRDDDQNWIQMKASYTSIVARLQILSDKLQSSGYAKESGKDPDTFKRHLSQTKASDQTTAPFKPAFVNSSMAQSYGVELSSASN